MPRWQQIKLFFSFPYRTWMKLSKNQLLKWQQRGVRHRLRTYSLELVESKHQKCWLQDRRLHNNHQSAAGLVIIHAVGSWHLLGYAFHQLNSTQSKSVVRLLQISQCKTVPSCIFRLQAVASHGSWNEWALEEVDGNRIGAHEKQSKTYTKAIGSFFLMILTIWTRPILFKSWKLSKDQI